MKWIIAPFLWLLAVVVALAVLWRLWRGQNVVLRGRWGPRFVRMVVVVLVLLGVGVEKAETAPVGLAKDGKQKPDEALPPSVTAEGLTKWAQMQDRRGEWMRFKQGLFRQTHAAGKRNPESMEGLRALARSLPPKFREIIRADLAALEAGKAVAPVRPRELLAALDELERAGYLDHWVNAYLWRKASVDADDRRATIDLFARLNQHARLTNALILAQGRIRPLMAPPQAWRSKGGRPHLLTAVNVTPQAVAQLLAMVGKLYATANAGTWLTDGLVQWSVARESAPVTLVRGGQGQVPQVQGTIRFGRLDLLETMPGDRPVVLEHAWLGRIELPAGRLISVRELPSFLSEKAKEKIKQEVAAAVDGKGDTRLLERSLPLVHPFVREALTTSPRTRGASRLRLVLALFDDITVASASIGDLGMLYKDSPGGRGR